MNIFAVHPSPEVSARSLCDRHVIKMILECAQMLCTIRNEQNLPSKYKSFNPKHPCNLWIASSSANYMWLIEHALFLADEYTVRYGKVHKSQAVIEACLDGMEELTFPGDELEPFVQCMPDQYKASDPCLGYQAFYIHEKAYFAKWEKRPGSKPAWFSGGGVRTQSEPVVEVPKVDEEAERLERLAELARLDYLQNK